MREGGIAIMELCPANDPEVRRRARCFDSTIYPVIESGKIDERRDYETWLREAGFDRIRLLEMDHAQPILLARVR